MKPINSYITEASAYKTWVIKTWGGGTPFYLVTAKTRERAWELVEEAWWKRYHDRSVGDYKANQEQNMDNLKEVPGVFGSKEYVVDLYEIEK